MDTLEEIEVDDMSDPKEVAAKYQKQLKKLAKHFNEKIKAVETSGKQSAQQVAVAQEEREILAFSQKHPWMNDPKVLAIMQPLYDSGKTLDESLELSARALGLDPETGQAPGETGEEDPNKPPAAGEEGKGGTLKAPPPKTSAKSDRGEEPSEPPEPGAQKEEKTIEQVLADSANTYIAEHGDPFAEKQT